MVGDLQAVLVEPVADALDQHGQTDQDRQVGLGCRAAAPGGPLKPQPADGVVHDGRGDRGEAQSGEGERSDEPPPRVAEDEEADVHAELRIGDAERRRLPPGEVSETTLPRRGAAGEQPDQRRRRATMTQTNRASSSSR